MANKQPPRSSHDKAARDAARAEQNKLNKIRREAAKAAKRAAREERMSKYSDAHGTRASTGDLFDAANRAVGRSSSKRAAAAYRSLPSYKADDGKILLEIDDIVLQEVMHYVHASSFEVSGLGRVIHEMRGDVCVLRVTTCHLLPQTNTSVHTEIDAEAVAKLEYDGRNDPGELRWWWHSHVQMAVFWSGEDRNTIAELSAPGWFAATVFNQKGEHRSAYAQGHPMPFMMDELKTVSQRQVDAALKAAWQKKYDEACRTRQPVTRTYDYGYTYPTAQGSSKWSRGLGFQSSQEATSPKVLSDELDYDDAAADSGYRVTRINGVDVPTPTSSAPPPAPPASALGASEDNTSAAYRRWIVAAKRAVGSVTEAGTETAAAAAPSATEASVKKTTLEALVENARDRCRGIAAALGYKDEELNAWSRAAEHAVRQGVFSLTEIRNAMLSAKDSEKAYAKHLGPWLRASQPSKTSSVPAPPAATSAATPAAPSATPAATVATPPAAVEPPETAPVTRLWPETPCIKHGRAVIRALDEYVQRRHYRTDVRNPEEIKLAFADLAMCEYRETATAIGPVAAETLSLNSFLSYAARVWETATWHLVLGEALEERLVRCDAPTRFSTKGAIAQLAKQLTNPGTVPPARFPSSVTVT